MCAPSNVAVDQLAEKISATGLKVRKQSSVCSYNSFIIFYFYMLIFCCYLALSNSKLKHVIWKWVRKISSECYIKNNSFNLKCPCITESIIKNVFLK